MPRPKCCRRIRFEPKYDRFISATGTVNKGEEIVLGRDELEAIRLTDLNGLYHEEAAASMCVSRATFGRLIASARGKIANALINGIHLRVHGMDKDSTAGVPSCPTCSSEADCDVCPKHTGECPKRKHRTKNACSGNLGECDENGAPKQEMGEE